MVKLRNPFKGLFKKKSDPVSELSPNLARFKKDFNNQIGRLIEEINKQNINEDVKSKKIESLESCRNTVTGFYDSLATSLIKLNLSMIVKLIGQAQDCEDILEVNRFLTEKNRIKKIREILEKKQNEYMNR